MNSFSGAFCAGLIEAYTNDLSPPGKALFSGAFCAGLIEARRAIDARRSGHSRFPALFAPASLKLDFQGGILLNKDEFSGAFCAGLIEAFLAQTDLVHNDGSFPALFAPASLKRHDARIACQEKDGGFPALFAPASLKQGFERRERRCLLSFSGAFCAGLIEAPE